MYRAHTLFLIVIASCGSSDDLALRPTANAGFDKRARVGDEVHLDASGSDENVNYLWSVAQAPEHSLALLSDPTSVTPSIVPDVVGGYMFALEVTRDDLQSEPDVVIVSAYNGAPTSSPECTSGSECSVIHGRDGGLDGRSSTDPDNDPLTYQWTQVTTAAQCATACPNLTTCDPSAAVAAIASATSALATFTAPNVAGQDLVFALAVDDQTASTSACVVYETRDTAPVASLAPSSGTVNPTTVSEGQVFSLNGSASGDADGDTLTFMWTQTASSFVADLATPTNQATSVVAPTLAADPGDLPFVDLTFTLTVSDGLETATTTIVVRVTNDA